VERRVRSWMGKELFKTDEKNTGVKVLTGDKGERLVKNVGGEKTDDSTTRGANPLHYSENVAARVY